MLAKPFSTNDALRQSARWSLPRQVALAEAGVIVLAGLAIASAVQLLDFSLRIPGHAILRSILPLSLGLALVPRRASGAMLGASSAVWTLVFYRAGLEISGIGALTSMIVVGPILDAALWNSRRGWNVYLRCALAGLCANLVAFSIRGGGKVFLWGEFTMRPFAAWWSSALPSYIACGLLAGLLSAVFWFRWNAPPSPSEATSTEGRS
jgi:hypothetical protein